MARKPTFYTAFANTVSKDETLPNLSEEALKISDLLQVLVFSDSIYYMKDEWFTVERLINNFLKYGEKMDIFYFSGHATDGALKLSDNFISKVDSLAEVVNNNLKNLQCAFFNACETFELASKIVEMRLTSGDNPNKLVMIASGKKINSYLAERFATHFFTHAGRDGTFYDAYKNASTLMKLGNEMQFKEFYSLEELKKAQGDFDYAFIDINKTNAAHTATPAVGTDVPKNAEKPPPSMINMDKKTKDLLSANYLKESTQTIINSKSLDNKQTSILINAIEATEKVANGDLPKVKVRNIWKKAASIIPGVDSKKDFMSLVHIEQGEYSTIMNKLTADAKELPTLKNIQQTIQGS